MKVCQLVPLALVLAGCTRTHTLNADQVKTIAREAANERTRNLHSAQPLWNGAPARFLQGKSVGSNPRGCRSGDLEATVKIATDGLPRSVELILLDSQRSDFLFTAPHLCVLQLNLPMIL
jgi:hypothetical protein